MKPLSPQIPLRIKSAGVLLLVCLVMACGSACRSAESERVTTAPAATPQPAASTNPLAYPSPVVGKPYYGEGVVKSIHVKEGWIELDHGEVKDLMPAMIMEFWVKERSLLQSVKVGDRVDFAVVETGKGLYITEITRKSERSK